MRKFYITYALQIPGHANVFSSMMDISVPQIRAIEVCIGQGEPVNAEILKKALKNFLLKTMKKEHLDRMELIIIGWSLIEEGNS